MTDAKSAAEIERLWRELGEAQARLAAATADDPARRDLAFWRVLAERRGEELDRWQAAVGHSLETAEELARAEK